MAYFQEILATLSQPTDAMFDKVQMEPTSESIPSFEVGSGDAIDAYQYASSIVPGINLSSSSFIPTGTVLHIGGNGGMMFSSSTGWSSVHAVPSYRYSALQDLEVLLMWMDDKAARGERVAMVLSRLAIQDDVRTAVHQLMIEDTAQTVALTIETSMVDSYEHTASYSWTCTKCEHYHAMVTVPRGVPLLCEECGTPMYVGVPTPVWDANSGSSEWSFGYTSVDPSRLAHLERIESALLWLNEAEHKYYRMGRLLDRLNDCPDLLLAIEQLRNSEVTDKLLGKSI